MPDIQSSAPKTGIETIIEYFNDLEKNHPVAIAEIVETTGFSWSFVKKTLKKFKNEEYCGFHFEKSGNIWIAWKDRDKITVKLKDTCGDLLKPQNSLTDNNT